MLKFFRHLRQRMLAENKISTYLLYAIGEILLVVVGILLALQVNNWNNDKKDRIRTDKMLSALYDEFTANKTQLTRVNSFHHRVNNGCKSLLLFISQVDNLPSERVMDSVFADYSYFLTFDPYNSALNAATSSGDIHLILNDSLKTLLFAWPAMVIDSNEEERQAKEVLFDQKGFFSQYVREKNIWRSRIPSVFKSNYKELFAHPDFENRVHFRSTIVSEILREQDELIQTNDKILALLKREMRSGVS